MTKELLPGLGSGALREALEPEVLALLKRVDEDAKGTRCLTMAEVTLCLNALKRLALSLSSPIEPSMASERTIAIRNAYERGKKDGLAAQASSEVREATLAVREVLRYWKHETFTRWKDGIDIEACASSCKKCQIEKALALAPSRQGAGGK